MSDQHAFQVFERSLIPDTAISESVLEAKFRVAGFLEFFQRYSGMAFANGTYHVFPYDQIAERTRDLEAAFPAFSKRTIPFAYNWLGDVFALDGARRENGEPLVLWFNYNDNSVLEIPKTFIQFHNEELPNVTDILLSKDLFAEYIGNKGVPPGQGQCCGYEVPLFLGGSEAAKNLRIIDADVYWHLTGQLISQVAGSDTT